MAKGKLQVIQYEPVQYLQHFGTQEARAL